MNQQQGIYHMNFLEMTFDEQTKYYLSLKPISINGLVKGDRVRDSKGEDWTIIRLWSDGVVSIKRKTVFGREIEKIVSPSGEGLTKF